MKPTLKPREFQAACNEIIYVRLKPLREELATLPNLQSEARGAADIDEVRRLRAREIELHESLLTAASAAKKELQSFLIEVQPLRDAEFKRADEAVAAEQASREALRKEYEERDKQAEQKISAAERARATFQNETRQISDAYLATMRELSDQIDTSLEAAA